MCLSVPMKVEMIEPPRARCSAMGQERWADLSLMAEDPPEVGDYVLIQFGFVQRKVDAVEAQESLRLFRDILTTLDAEG
ncbi:MAG: HypC/HybG/HupF family hydrogenase formation chaperone [Rhodobacteraceae bacterium]|nr:HypC/HybG/HupF family hydrogenase formation chaperone [Paracoccaceae bacterium]